MRLTQTPTRQIPATLIPTPSEARAELARRRLASFFRESWPVLEPSTTLDWNWHLEALCDHVQAVLDDWRKVRRDPTHEQRIKNLAINISPGCSKSRVLSVCAVAWQWLHEPSWRVICLSANPRVAMRDSQYCRE